VAFAKDFENVYLERTAMLNDRGMREPFEVKAANRIVRETLYSFCQGMKVAVEVALMAADAGLLDMGSEVTAVAGSDEGADTAVVLQPAYAREFRKLRVREILAKPR
jgi:hypothetical protein